MLSFFMYKFFNYCRIVADNFDLTVKARIQTKHHSNQSIHWSHQYAIQDRIPTSVTLNEAEPQCRLADLELNKLLPSPEIQAAFRRDCVVLASHIITKYLPAFNFLKDTVIHHIPHPFSSEMSQKSLIVSML